MSTLSRLDEFALHCLPAVRNDPELTIGMISEALGIDNYIPSVHLDQYCARESYRLAKAMMAESDRIQHDTEIPAKVSTCGPEFRDFLVLNGRRMGTAIPAIGRVEDDDPKRDEKLALIAEFRKQHPEFEDRWVDPVFGYSGKHRGFAVGMPGSRIPEGAKQ